MKKQNQNLAVNSIESREIDFSATSPKELQEKAEWLKQKIDEAIENVGRKRAMNQKKATYIKIASIAFSGTATILLGLPISGYEPILRSIAFVFAALVTLLSAIEPFFNYRGLWVEHERAKYRLHTLRDEIDFYLSGTEAKNISINKLSDFHKKYVAIFVDLSTSWLEQRQGSRYMI